MIGGAGGGVCDVGFSVVVRAVGFDVDGPEIVKKKKRVF